MSAIDQEREQLILSLMGCFSKLIKLRSFLSPDQRIYISEELRSLADAVDEGRGDALQHRLARRKMVLISPATATSAARYKLI